MKSIRIRGKRNIDSMEDGKKAVRTGMDNVGDELMLHETQKTMVNKLYLGEDFDQSTTLKKELTRKINSYKGQDVKKEPMTRVSSYRLKIQSRNLYRQSYCVTTVIRK